MVFDEVWDYDPARQVARLTDLQTICRPCHAVIQHGEARSRLGPRAAAEAPSHMARVNGTTRTNSRQFRRGLAPWLRLGVIDRWTIEVSESVRKTHLVVVSAMVLALVL
jgi:hypothetical protein